MSKPTPYPIAFEEAIKLILDEPLTKDNAEEIAEDFTGYVSAKIIAAHNQSLQTAVTQARIDELKRVVEQLPGEHTNHGIRIGVAEAYHVLEIVIEARIAELTKAKEVNNV